LFCDLREWNNLRFLPPPERHEVAKEWLKKNQKQCLFGQQIYIRNSMPRVLGTSHQVDVDALTWGLVQPEAEKTQVITKKREI